MPALKFSVFVDPRYSAERWVEIEPKNVANVEEKTAKLFLAGRHPVTVVRLRNGQKHLLSGHVAAQISEAKIALGDDELT